MYNDNKEVYTKQLKSELILPSLSKTFSDSWTAPDSEGVYEAHIEFAIGNTGEIGRSNKEKVVVLLPIWKIIVIGILTVCALHLMRKRKNHLCNERGNRS